MAAKTKAKVMTEQHSKSAKRNKKVFILLAMTICILVNASAAFALPGGLGSIETKASDIRDLCIAVAAIIVVIGAIWSGVKFIKGDPDSWGYVWKFALGAIIVYAAPEIVMWLST